MHFTVYMYNKLLMLKAHWNGYSGFWNEENVRNLVSVETMLLELKNAWSI